MKPSIFLFLFLSLSFLHLLRITSMPSAAVSHPDIVRDTCQKCASTDPNVNFDTCMTSFDLVPKSHNSSLRGLGIIATKLAKANATRIHSKLRRLLDSPIRDGYMRSCLESCLELYSDSVSSLNDSVGAIRAGRYDDANVWISAVVDAPSECEDGFSEGEIESPMTEDDEGFFELSVIALSVVAMLQGHVY